MLSMTACDKQSLCQVHLVLMCNLLASVPFSVTNPSIPPHHVIKGAQAAHGGLLAHVDDKPKVSQLDTTVRGEQNVLRLDVSVDDALHKNEG